MTHAERLKALRAELQRAAVDAFLLQRTDAHGSEYLPDGEQRVAWLTGFTGSAAMVALTRTKAAVFSDGRYTVQLAEEVDESLFERRHVIKEPPAGWLESNMPEGGRLGYDPMLTRKAELERLEKVVGKLGGQLCAIDDPFPAIWADRPAPPVAPVERLDDAYAGETSAAKRERIGKEIEKAAAAGILVTATDNIAWLLNIRGADIPFNPLCLSHLLLNADGTCRWLVDPRKIPDGFVLDSAVMIENPDRLDAVITEQAGRKILVDPALTHVGYMRKLEAAGAGILEAADPITLAKAKKNATEIRGAIEAQRRDGAAMVRFLAWLDVQPKDGTVSEISAADRLLAERSKDPLFRGPSFDTISAHGPHAALPHYRVTTASDRPLTGGTVYLVDSGGQYLDGTTDITRTIALGTVSDEIRTRNTLVLQGHIRLAVTRFPTSTSGAQLDTLARHALWQRGLDFDHGTGHGIGSYLCVHEGPNRIAKTGTAALEPGMITSNEPGYYKAGAYGIRIENLVVTEKADPQPEGAEREMLAFHTITLCPIDRRLVVTEMLDAEERRWLDDYHARVLAELSPLLDEGDRAWLRQACAPSTGC